MADRDASVLYAMGRLRAGATLAQASEQNTTIWARLSEDRPSTAVVQYLRVVPFWQAPGSAQSIMLPLLTVLSVMGLFVLMVACANIAGLVVVRGISRRGEIALRLAIGASRARIVRLLIVENLVLAAPGALLGVLLAARALPWLVGRAQELAAPERLYMNIETDTLVIGFAVVVAVGCALLFGFVPALRSSKVDLVSVINEESPRGVSRSTLRSSLVVAQVAVSLLLLVGAGLVTRSLEAAREADRGYDPTHVTAVTVDLKANGYDEAHGRTFYRQLLEAARATPGVEAATLATYTPLTFLDTRAERVDIDGYQTRQDEDLSMLSNVVAPDYFRTLRIPVVAGREFMDSDDTAAARVAIVNRTLAERFWGSAAAAMGQRLRIAGGDWRTIVGVAADVKYARVDEAPRPYVYLPFLQAYRSGMTLHTRGPQAVDTLVGSARRAVVALDPDLPIIKAASLEQATRGALLFFQLAAMMLFAFGAAGLTMAGMGTYGLVAYTVKQSARDIGIRMALGAPGLWVVRGFLWRGLRLGVIGALLGIAAAFGASRFMAGLLFGVSAADGPSFATAIAVVLGGVVAATMLPAWRAARTDPLRVLRHQ